MVSMKVLSDEVRDQLKATMAEVQKLHGVTKRDG
jgi:hypothetical protein